MERIKKIIVLIRFRILAAKMFAAMRTAHKVHDGSVATCPDAEKREKAMRAINAYVARSMELERELGAFNDFQVLEILRGYVPRWMSKTATRIGVGYYL